MGLTTLTGNSEFRSLPPTRINPELSINGHNERILLDELIALPQLNALYSSEKEWRCTALHIVNKAENVSSGDMNEIDGFVGFFKNLIH